MNELIQRNDIGQEKKQSLVSCTLYIVTQKQLHWTLYLHNSTLHELKQHSFLYSTLFFLEEYQLKTMQLAWLTKSYWICLNWNKKKRPKAEDEVKK